MRSNESRCPCIASILCILALALTLGTHAALAQPTAIPDDRPLSIDPAVIGDLSRLVISEELGVAASAMFVSCSSQADCKSGELCDVGVCITQAVKRGAGASGDYCYRTDHCSSRLCLCAAGLGVREHFTLEEAAGACLPRSRGVACQPRQALGQRCWIDANCVSGSRCRENRCVPVDGTGQRSDYCHHAEHCESKLCVCSWDGSTLSSGFCGSASSPAPGFCTDRRNFSDPCSRNENCPAGGQCVERRCAPLNRTGGPGGPTTYCHHDDHCASNLCDCPGGKRNGFCGTSSRPETGNCRAAGATAPRGGFCRSASDCAIGDQCREGRCAPQNGAGISGEYCHHDDHCDPRLTCRCPLGKSWGFCANFEDGRNRGTCR